jgi:DNA-binding CsgD family transcriptional regulator
LPRREAEVCARILYGMSSVGIALDLSVSEETVKTYRKRAYQRLNIGSERELLTWYLARWSRWRGHRFELAAPAAHVH